MSSGGFAVEIALDARPPVVTVRGEVDILTAPPLRAALDVVVRAGTTAAVLDLAAATFFDASGLNVIVDTAAELRRNNGVLTVRSAQPQALRILELSGVDASVFLEATSPAELVDDMVHAGTLRGGHVVIDGALRMMTELAVTTMAGADGVSVSLQRHGRLRTVASSNETVLRMDDHQYTTGEGPCLAAADEGRVFHIPSLAEDPRWPAFVPLAVGEGIASILSTPLLTARGALGALNIYSNEERTFGVDEHALAGLFAHHASELLDDAEDTSTDDELGGRIHRSLLARQVIARAQGVLMGRDGAGPDQASASLHRDARRAGVTVLEQAAEMLAATVGRPTGGGRIG